mgnify:CR=1 FL=1
MSPQEITLVIKAPRNITIEVNAITAINLYADFVIIWSTAANNKNGNAVPNINNDSANVNVKIGLNPITSTNNAPKNITIEQLIIKFLNESNVLCISLLKNANTNNGRAVPSINKDNIPVNLSILSIPFWKR